MLDEIFFKPELFDMNKTTFSSKAIAAIFAALCLVQFDSSIAQADLEFQYENPQPFFEHDDGPIVCFDSGHGNFHTVDEALIPLSNLLRDDGFKVEELNISFTLESLGSCDILIISTPSAPVNLQSWDYPHPSAFTSDEIVSVYNWTNNGGGLLLIADHSPIPGALADLGIVFGIAFADIYARNTPGGQADIFTLDSGTLIQSIFTQGRSRVDSVESVATWTGAAFQVSDEFDPIIRYGSGAFGYPMLSQTIPEIPREEFPSFNIEGWLLAAARTVAQGRLVVLGEVSMCTALTAYGGDLGMNTEEGAQNPRFCLNVARWLGGAPRYSDQ